MTKQEEIKVLRKLADQDTYFAQYFGDDIDKMIENIENDYPIEMGCEFHKEAEKERTRFKEREAARKAQLADLAYNLLAGEINYDEVSAILRGVIGLVALCDIKVENNLPLTAYELKELVKRAKDNQ